MGRIKSKYKIALAIITVFAIVIAVGVYLFFVRGVTQDVNWLFINSIDVSENAIIINASNPNSGDMISGYHYTIKDETVYIKLRGTVVNRLGNPISPENIVINNDFSNINQIALLGSDNQSITIWNK